MTRSFSDPKYRAGEKGLDLALQMKLRQWISGSEMLTESNVQWLLTGMHQFARETRSGGFDRAFRNLAGETAGSVSPVFLVEVIANRLCQGIDPSGDGIEEKSLQETLYYCTGIEAELPQPQFGKRLEDFLVSSGSEGFLRIFLGVHLSNLVLKLLQDSLQAAAPEELHGQTRAIERMCQKVAISAIRPFDDWPPLNRKLMTTLLSDLKTTMIAMLDNKISLHRGV